jgi:hypothetical protein
LTSRLSLQKARRRHVGCGGKKKKERKKRRLLSSKGKIEMRALLSFDK